MTSTTHEQATPTTASHGQRLVEGYAPSQISYPSGWYLFCRASEARRGPVRKTLLNKKLVAFVTESGNPGVIAAGCVHMGADLGGGEIVGETLRCPLHHWRFDVSGRCCEIPASDDVPGFAQQRGYPATIRHGNLYFFKGDDAAYPLPFFEGVEVAELVASRPFIEYVDCPWYMVGANAVDVQHFAIAHDREMLGRPEVAHPNSHVHNTVCRFRIRGGSVADALTRHFGGPESRLEVTDWSSTMIFARSTLARSETFGMLSLVPVSERRTMVQVIVMAKRGSNPMRRLLDPARARIRRALIRRFLRSDVGRLSGTFYSPNSLIEIDQQFGEYFDWLATLPR
ncbi:MAG: Rieske 2Fe-2S domain-containing protein [Planctomycetales bacterium]|nr:Rieske 2Fe-2S domain-containing protein [Planctomycetales bacterium]